VQDLAVKLTSNRQPSSFLLAQIYISRLKDLTTPSKIREELQKIQSGESDPEALKLAYDDMLERIDHLRNKHFIPLARRALVWVAFAKRALTVTELLHALAIEPQMTYLTNDNLPRIEDVEYACCGLLEVSSKTQVVRLVHNTTQDYLQKAKHNWLLESHNKIASACITYLRFDAFSRGPLPNVGWFGPGELNALLLSHPLLAYASSNWAYHLSQAGKFSGPRLLPELCNALQNLQLSFQVHSIALRQRFPAQIRPTHIISSLGCPELLRALDKDKLLEKYAMDSGGRTGMHWAVQRTDGEARAMAKELIKLGFDVNTADVEGRTPLHIAACAGDAEAVKLLLDHGADKEMGDAFATPLVEACCSGRADVVRMLSSAGANVNAKSHKFGTPLEAAIMSTSEDCVNILLSSKRLKKRRRTEFGTALHDAASFGSPNIVTAILDTGGFELDQDGPRGTPLQVAIAGDHNHTAHKRDAAGVVSLLLDRGANVNHRGKFGTALDTAQDLGNLELERLLRRRGAREGAGLAGRSVPRKRILRNDSSFLATEASQSQQSQLFPEALRNRGRQFIIAVMMSNERLISEHTTSMISSFRNAIMTGNTDTLRALAESSVLEFGAMVELAKYDIECEDGTGKGRPRYSPILKLAATIATRWSHFPTSFLDIVHRVRRSRQDSNLSGALHAAGAASANLELMTAASIQILADALEFGTEEMVRMLANYWIGALRKIFFPGKASDQMMEVLVRCRADEFAGCFRDKNKDKAIAIADAGLELMAVVLEGPRDDTGLMKLRDTLGRIWPVALRDAIDKGYINHTELVDFFWEYGMRLWMGFKTGAWQPFKRIGAAVMETLIRVVADGDIRLAFGYAKSAANNMHLAIEYGEFTLVVERGLLRHLETELWEAADGMRRLETESGLQDVAGSSLWNAAGALLNIFHGAVQLGFYDVADKLSDWVFKNLDSIQEYGAMLGRVTGRQLAEFMPPWCDVDQTALHYFRTLSSLYSIAQRSGRPSMESAVRKWMIGILTKPSKELGLLKERVGEDLSVLHGQDEVETVRAAVEQLKSDLGVDDLFGLGEEKCGKQ